LTIQTSDIAVVKIVDNATTNVGESALFTITVTNNGPTDATNIIVNDKLPSGYKHVSNLASNGTYDQTTGIWTLGNLENGSEATLQLAAEVLAVGQFGNTASLTSLDQFDNNTDNNESTAAVIAPVADIGITFTVNNDRPNVNNEVEFTVKAINNGPDDATSVNVESLLAGGLSFVSATPTQGTFTSSTSLWEIGSIVKGAEPSLTIKALVISSDNYLSISKVISADQYDNVTSNNEVQLTIFPTESDLLVEMAVENSNPNVGDNLKFSVKVTNLGPDETTNVLITDLVPNGYTYISATPSQGTYDNTTGVWTVGTIANGAFKTLDINVTTNADGEYKNTAEVTSSDHYDPDVTNNIASSTPVIQKADLQITKQVDNANPNPGDIVSFVISLTNNGPSAAQEIKVYDRLPSGYEFINATVSQGDIDTNTFIWDVGELSNQDSAVLLISARVNSAGFFENEASINNVKQFDPDLSNNVATATVVLQLAELAITKSIDKANPNIGEGVNFTVNLTNNGPLTATNVEVTDLLPVGYELVTSQVSQGGYINSSGIWTVGSMLNGATASLLISATVTNSNAYTNVATITASDQFDIDLTNNEASIAITLPKADIAITKTVDNGSANVGDFVLFTVTATNNGPDIATGVIIQDLLPSGYTLIESNTTNGVYDDLTGAWRINTIANGGTETLTIQAKVKLFGVFTNEATLEYLVQVDTDETNNRASAIVNSPYVDLILSKTVDNTIANPGDQVIFTITIQNPASSTSPGTGIIVLDQLPSGYTLVGTPVVSQGSFDVSNGKWAVGDISIGSTATMSITALVNEMGVLTNIAAIIFADQFDPNIGNNLSTASVGVQISDLIISQTVNNPTPEVEENVIFTIDVFNDGPDPSTGVSVTDLLPDGYFFVDAVTNTGTYVETTGLWTIGSIPTNTFAKLSLTAEVRATGNHTNESTITTQDQVDPDITSNIASAFVTPQIADLAITKTLDISNPNVGSDLVFNVSLLNNGPSNATNIELIDLLPTGYQLVSSSVSSGSYDPATGFWEIPVLATNASSFLTISATVLSNSNLTNTATIEYSDQFDSDLSNNTASAEPSVAAADLGLLKTVDNPNANSGETVVFTIKASNNGPDNATGIVIEDHLPSGYTLTSSSVSSGSFTEGVWDLGNLNNGSFATLSLTASVKTSGIFTNSATIKQANEYDGNEANNSSAATVVSAHADLEVMASVDNDNPLVGDEVNFSFTIKNLGTSDATGVAIKNLLPSGFNFIESHISTGSLTKTEGNFREFEIGAMAIGSIEVLTIKAVVNLDGIHTTITSITNADQHDPVLLNNVAAKGVTLQESDIEINKVVDNATPNVNENVVFTISASNNGPNKATNLSVIDLLPSGYNYVNSTPSSGTYNFSTGVWALNELDKGIAETLEINAQVNATGIFENVAYVSPLDQIDNNVDNDTARVSVSPQLVDLVITKVVDNASPIIREEIVFTITVTNNGPNDATGVIAKDLLPSGYLLRSTTTTPNTTYDQNTGIFSIGTLFKGANAVLTIRARTLTSGDHNNTASITHIDQFDTDLSNNSVTTAVTLQKADLAITKTVANENTAVGDNAVFTITVTNNGPNNATGVIVVDLLPNRFEFVNAVSATGSYGNTTGLWAIGDLANGSSTTLSITATVLPLGDFNNTASIIFSNQLDENSDNNAANAEVFPPYTDLSISKSVDADNPNVGEQISFFVLLTNNGPSATDATSVEVTDLLPSGYTLVSTDVTQGTYNATSGLWTVGNLPLSTSVSMTIFATVNASGDFTNTAQITNLDQFDPNLGDNISSASIIAQSADLEVEKTINNEKPNIGDAVIFTVKFTNNGPDPATNVQGMDLLPSGYDFLYASTSHGSYNSSTGIWTIGSIAKSDSAQLQILAKVEANGDYVNTASVLGADQNDPDLTNNSDTAGLTAEITDLSVSMVASQLNPIIGETIAFTISLNNLGPENATGIEVENLVPSGFVLSSTTVTKGNYDAEAGIWSLSDLNNGSSAVLTLITQISEFGDHTNTASIIASDQYDSNLTNDTTSITINIQTADLGVLKTVDNNIANVNESVVFTIQAFNLGPDDATSVEITDLLPSGYNLQSVSALTGTYVPAIGVWTIGNLASQDTVSLTLQAEVLATGDGLNLATISNSDQADLNLLNNESGVSVNFPIADLGISKTSDKTRVDIGEEVNFTINVKNEGPETASDIEILELIPSGYILEGSTVSKGDYDASTGIWSIDKLLLNEQAILEIKLTTLAEGSLTNIASIRDANEYDPNMINNIAGASVSPRTADIAVIKVINNAIPNINEHVTFTITASNNGPDDATNVIITDQLPSGYEIIEVKVSTGTVNLEESSWTIPQISNGQSQEATIIAKVLEFGEYDNTASVTKIDQKDYNTDNNVSTVKVAPQKVDLEVSKIVDKDYVNIGEEVNFEIRVKNNGPNAASEIELLDLLPNGYTYKEHFISQGTYDSLTGLWDIGILINGASSFMVIKATVNRKGTYTNVASIQNVFQFDRDNTNDAASTFVSIKPADLGVTKTVDKLSPLIGEEIIFLITLSNNGPEAATNIEVQDLLPSGYAFVRSSSQGVYDKTSGKWTIPELIVGESVILQIAATVKPTGDYLNIAEIIKLDQADLNPSNDRAEVKIEPAFADLGIAKSVNNVRPSIGEEIVFTVELNNNGPNNATNILVYDKIPAGYNYVSHTVTSGDYDPLTGYWSVASLDVGTTQTFDMTVIVGTTGNYVNFATITKSDQIDPDPSNNQATKRIELPRADLSIVKTIDNDDPSSGDQVTFVLTIKNNGRNAGTNVVVDELLPSGYQFVSAFATIGSYDPVAGTWDVGTLVVSTPFETLTIVCNILDAGEYINTATIYSTEVDPDETNNTSTVELTYNKPPVAANDFLQIVQNTVLNGLVTVNDFDPDDDDLSYSLVSGGSAEEFGALVFNTDGSFSYTPGPNFHGTVGFTYLLCDNGIPVKCDNALVAIEILQDSQLDIISGISPNDDGNTDVWEIGGIEKFPQNNVKIFNRWGNLVYETDGYDNISKRFEGIAVTGLFIGDSSGLLPESTYFYVIDLKNGTKPLSGFLLIKR